MRRRLGVGVSIKQQFTIATICACFSAGRSVAFSLTLFIAKENEHYQRQYTSKV